VLISGTGGAADELMVAVDPDDPQAAPRLSDRSVFDQVARVTRVCAYDRPGTSTSDGALSPSTTVAQPTSALTGVRDLDEVLTATGETGPYVLVGAS
jgi:pimeloyl-ACP methyl ester carboxylesterase